MQDTATRLFKQSSSDLITGSGAGYPSVQFTEELPGAWIFIFLLAGLIGIAILRYQFNRRFRQSLQAFFQFYTLNQFTREGNFITEQIGLLFYAIYLIGLSMFTYQASIFLPEHPVFSSAGLPLYLKILSGYTLFFLAKTGFHSLTGVIFETREASYLVVLDDFLFGCINGLILLPFLFLTTYSPSAIIFYSAITLLVLTFIYRLARATMIGYNQTQFSLFYLFLYLCSLEIVPVIIITKIFAGNTHI
ncbi:MAG: DUF4271 domain-containing protein [Bacteroidia bacterium]|nr:DUF4271 domain-containing protein [Bacteroidia bacterium]